MKQSDVDELAKLGLQLHLAARSDPAAVVLAAVDHLLERSLGDNAALRPHLKLKAYRAIVAALERNRDAERAEMDRLLADEKARPGSKQT